MQTQREILQERVAVTERVYLAAVRESDRLHGQVVADRQAIEQLTVQYEQTCRELAAGASNVDPATVLAARDRIAHRLKGLEVLEAEANAAALPANEAHASASLALQGEVDREELAGLEMAIAEANGKQAAATATLREAEKLVTDAVWARSRFLRHQELKVKARA
jgi:hypothetical protein